jgi:hypothetical protein
MHSPIFRHCERSAMHGPIFRHCERSEAIHAFGTPAWIAASLRSSQ